MLLIPFQVLDSLKHLKITQKEFFMYKNKGIFSIEF